jgi:hypothetical protein
VHPANVEASDGWILASLMVPFATGSAARRESQQARV